MDVAMGGLAGVATIVAAAAAVIGFEKDICASDTGSSPARRAGKAALFHAPTLAHRSLEEGEE
jgi:hypothetical protein